MRINNTKNTPNNRVNNSVRNQGQTFGSVKTSGNVMYFPDKVGKLAFYTGTYVGTPESKLITGTLCAICQPLIDMAFAPEDKKVDSAIKSSAKSIAGTLTGVSIRKLFIYLCRKNIKMAERGDKGFVENEFLMAKNIFTRLFRPRFILNQMKYLNRPTSYTYHGRRLMDRDEIYYIYQRQLDKYNNFLGASLALVTMVLFTNSAIDVPLTSDIQDLLSKIIKEKKNFLTSVGEVCNERKDKIINWFKDRKKDLLKIKGDVVSIKNIIEPYFEKFKKAKKVKKDNK